MRPMLAALALSLLLAAGTARSEDMAAEPFVIAFPETAIADLRNRLAATRWLDQIPGSGWDYGIDTGYLESLTDYWAEGYDFAAAEARLNAHGNFMAKIDGVGLHFLHVRSDHADAIPLLMLHGWPSSFVQMLDIIPLLTDPPAGEQAFHVVVPSLIGFGYSSIPEAPGMSPSAMAPYMHRLMTEVLGYDRYGLRSSDLGAGVAARMAADYGAAIFGSHTGGTNPWLGPDLPPDLTEEEAAFVADAQAWMQTEMAYAMLQSSKPQTLAVGLTDSPAGLAAWIVEKFHRWVDHDGDLESVVDRDTLLDNLTVYWMTGTINPSVRLYAEAARDASGWAVPAVPVGYLMPRNDFFPTPRSWIEREGPVGHWTELAEGGHFLELEAPGIVAADLRTFFAPLAP